MPQRFLLSRLSSLGDVVCSLPAACALRRTFPESEIVWAVDPRFAGVVECCSAVSEVRSVKPGFSPGSWPRYEQRFDVALDLQGLLKSAVCIARAQAGRKLGYHWQREGSWIFSQRVIPDASSHHVVDQYVDVARAAGAEADRAEFMLVPSVEAVESVAQKLRALGVGRYVVVNPGAGWVSKRWPPEHFGALIDLVHAAGVQVVLVGGRAESDRAAASEVVAACREAPSSLVGDTSIKELIALIAGGLAHVGGDTGTSHIAAALGTPAVGLYSITRPRRSCPYGQAERCHHSSDSLAAIHPQAVWDTMQSLLS